MSIVERLRLLARAEWNNRAPGSRQHSIQRVLREARAELAELTSLEQRRRRSYQDTLDKAADYRDQAERWIRQGRDEYATAFLREEANTQQQARMEKVELDALQTQLEQLRAMVLEAEQRARTLPAAQPSSPPRSDYGLLGGSAQYPSAPQAPPRRAAEPPAAAPPPQEAPQAWPAPPADFTPPSYADSDPLPPPYSAGPPAPPSAASWPEPPAPPLAVEDTIAAGFGALSEWERELDQADAEAGLAATLHRDLTGEDPELEARFKSLERRRDLDDLKRRAADEDGD